MLFLTVAIARQDLSYQGQGHRALPGEGVPVEPIEHGMEAPEVARERLSEYFTMASTAMINRAWETRTSPTSEAPETAPTGESARMDE